MAELYFTTLAAKPLEMAYVIAMPNPSPKW
jgi:hypothetical protein